MTDNTPQPHTVLYTNPQKRLFAFINPLKNFIIFHFRSTTSNPHTSCDTRGANTILKKKGNSIMTRRSDQKSGIKPQIYLGYNSDKSGGNG
jgi:hypothetical protein